MLDLFRLSIFSALVLGYAYFYRITLVSNSNHWVGRARRGISPQDTFVALADLGVYSQCNEPAQIALNFDEGPSDYSADIVQFLNNANVKATFHPNTKLINSERKKVLQDAHKSGHIIGIRFDPTIDPRSLSDADLRAALWKQSADVYDIIGTYPKFLRYSYGTYGEREIAVAKDAGLTVTVHNLDSNDYKAKPTESQTVIASFINAFAAAASRAIKPTFISRQSDLYKSTLLALPDIVGNIRAYGYNPVTLQVCTGVSPYGNSNILLPPGEQPPAGTKVNSASRMLPALPILAGFVALRFTA